MSTDNNVVQFSDLRIIDVQQLAVNTRKIQAGLIAPSKEEIVREELADEHDAELGGVRRDIVAELSHHGVEVEACDKDAMTDGQLAVLHGRTQVEEPCSEGQHLLHRFGLVFTRNHSGNGACTRERA